MSLTTHLVLSPGSITVTARASEPMACVQDFLGTQHSLRFHFFISLRDRPLCCEEYAYTWYIHISDCVQIVYGLPLLQNNTASEIFLHKSGAVRSVAWIFIIGALA
jgi:hypothetical protein